ncbi:MAG: hypothetical protein JWM99_4295 [Verrucomicrobiales bacterium]|nr:hypothetical protein [Verrucomicrobiales bacterium]
MKERKERATGYPTGFGPDTLPIYISLDPARFESFCTALLNSRPVIQCERNGRTVGRCILQATRVLSGKKPQKGMDIWAKAEKGEEWLFQCKRVQRFGKEEVRKVIQDAEEGFPHMDQYVLVATCVLNSEAQAEIHKRSKWLLWDEARLTIEITRLRPRENAINLVHQFFDPDTAKRLFHCNDHPLLTWSKFFDHDLAPERQFFQHRTKFVPWSNALEQLETFARSGTSRALILSASGGRGKSRLLLELAQNLDHPSGSPRVRFLNLNSGGLMAEQIEFLSREEEDLVLIVDDAHRLGTALEDVIRATVQAKSIRLLIATRPQALDSVKSQLHRFGYDEKVQQPISLPRWKAEEIQILAERVLEPQHRGNAPHLARLADRCPLLVVLGGALINSGAGLVGMNDQEAFRERVFRSFKEDFLLHQPEGKRERLDRLIRLISFVSPTPNNEALWSKSAEVLGCMPLDIEEDLGSLQVAGMLVENSEGIRLYPDLFADAVLLDACLDQAAKTSALYRQIVAKLPAGDFPALMRNLAQADWEARTIKGAKHSLFDPIWDEFVQRFETGEWPNPLKFIDFESGLEAARKKDSAGPPLLQENGAEERNKKKVNRSELLHEWASFSVFLPERTLELAELAIQTAHNQNPDKRAYANASVCAALPPLLQPIVTWHPRYAASALDLLWSLDADDPKSTWENNSNAIAVIAEAASFGVQKPLKTSKTVIGWLQSKFKEPAAIERLRSQPWILSGLLKPFFGREIEEKWLTGRTMHLTSRPVAADKTRGIRDEALTIAKEFLNGTDLVLCHAVLPVIEEAIHPLFPRLGSPASETDHASWRPDRLAVLKLIEDCLELQRNTPVVLLRLRHLLQRRGDHDPDEVVRQECCRVLAQMPDTFELRVMRALTSWAHDEIRVRTGPDFDLELRTAEVQWTEFRKSVARELVERFGTAGQLCDFIRGQIQELATTNSTVTGGALLDVVAETSPIWCASILEHLIATPEDTLDRCLGQVIHLAAKFTPEVYHKTVEFLPTSGRPEQICSLINYLGWKQLHGGGLESRERKAILEASERPEETVVRCLATVADRHFRDEPLLATDVLSRLKAGNRHAGAMILESLSNLAERHRELLIPAKVAQCLANAGEFAFPDSISSKHNVQRLSKAFPKEVYEHFRKLHEAAEAGITERHWRAETLALGFIDDLDYVENEIRSLWDKSLIAEDYSFAQNFRLSLIRSLIWSDSKTAPNRIRKLVAECGNGEQLKHVAAIVTDYGSRFVFLFPDLVHLLLNRSEEFAVAGEVRQTLLHSACGGGRSFTEDELDPEYRYILDQSSDLANRYRDNPLLTKFYRAIAESEWQQLKLHKQIFAQEVED